MDEATIEAPPAAAPAAAAPAPATPAPATRSPFAPAAPATKPERSKLFAKIDAQADKEFQDSSTVKLAKRAEKKAIALADPPAELDKPADAPAAKPEDKPADNPADKPADAPADPFPDDSAAGKMRAGELSRHYKALRKEHAALKDKMTKIEADRAKAPTEDPERVKMTETLAERENRIEQLSEVVRFKAFEESDEYKQKYYEPYLSAFDTARNKVAQLRVLEVTDPDTGVVTQAARRGTPEDFDRLFQIQDESDAGEVAYKLFGANASAVMYHREKVLEANQSRLKAVETYRKEGGEIEKKRAESFGKLTKEIADHANKAWTKHVNSVLEDPKLGPMFKPIEGDDEANTLLDKGFEQVREGFKVMNPLDPRLTPEQREKAIASHAEIFNKAAVADRLLYLLSKEKKAHKEAQARLKAFEDSEPKPGNGKLETGTVKPASNARQHFYDALQKRAIPSR